MFPLKSSLEVMIKDAIFGLRESFYIFWSHQSHLLAEKLIKILLPVSRKENTHLIFQKSRGLAINAKI